MRIPLSKRIIVGDLWDTEADLIAVTGNGTISTFGVQHLVMGRGAAAEAAQRYPKLANLIAISLKTESLYQIGRYYVYGFRVFYTEAAESVGPNNRKVMGVFQVKYDFKAPASLALIGYSVIRLNYWLDQFYPAERFPNYRVALNFPGIGYGRLPESVVLPLLEDLDDRVLIYKLEETK